jgi:uncharacterized membrane protein
MGAFFLECAIDWAAMYQIEPAGQDDKTMALVSWILSIVAPVLGPLIIWAIKKDQSKFVAFHAMQAVFFGLAMSAIAIVTLGIGGIITGPALLIVSIIWALKANKGEVAAMPVIGGWAASACGLK